MAATTFATLEPTVISLGCYYRPTSENILFVDIGSDQVCDLHYDLCLRAS